MSQSKSPHGILVAKSAFYVGGTQLVQAGDTVAEGHPIAKGREHLFEPFVPTFAVAETPSKPEGAPAANDALAARRALVERAKELGIPAKGPSAELEAAIAEAEAKAAAGGDA